MSSVNFGTMQQLEEKVVLILKNLKLQNDFKQLLSEVSHDLSSPLGYMKFSTELLLSQIDSKTNTDLKETARVISSSTTKLYDDAKTIVENNKLRLPKDEYSTEIKDILLSSFKLCNLEINPAEIKGKLDIQLKKHPELYIYVLCSVINELVVNSQKIENIEVKKIKESFNIKINLIGFQRFKVIELQERLEAIQKQQNLNYIMSYLDAEIEFSAPNNQKVTLDIVFTN